MTVTQASSRSPLFTGNGSKKTFAFAFKVLSDDDLKVYLYDTVSEVTTLLEKDTDFSVTLADGGESGGSITTVVAPASDEKLRIYRSTPKDQETDIPDQGNFYPSVLNAALDKLTLQVQELSEIIDRAIVLDPMSPDTPADLIARIDDAFTTAATANSTAGTALNTAQSAVITANSAVSTANTAASNASTAVGVANSALSTAASAVNTATAANVTANNALNTANGMLTSMQDYVNKALAASILISSNHGVAWTTTINDGATYLDTPFLITSGLLFVGGVLYNLSDSNHVTLSIENGYTRITFPSPIVGTHESILIVLSTGNTWTTTLEDGDITVTTPISFTKGVFMVGGLLYDLTNAAHATLDNSGATTVINFTSAISGTHEAILITFG